MHAPHPWYTIEYRFGTVLHDVHGRRIAEIFHDERSPQTSADTARLIKLAPTLLWDLKMTADILDNDILHEDLANYLFRTIATADVSPEQAMALLRLSA